MEPATLITAAKLAWDVGNWAYNRFWGDDDKDDDLKLRQALGAQAQAAQAQEAKALRSRLHQQLVGDIIPTINQQWAPRYGSGQRLEAIQDATQASQMAYAQGLGSTAMDRYMADIQLQMALQQLTSQEGIVKYQGESGQWGSIGQVLPYLLEYYINEGKKNKGSTYGPAF